MFRRDIMLFTLGVVLCGGLLSSSLRADPVKKQSDDHNSGLRVQEEDLHPFTHFAYIPAGSDLSTIRFEKARTVEVPSKIRYTTDTNYCAQRMLFSEPGGSMWCPHKEAVSPVPAYEVTFSFHGQELASEEYKLGHSIFQVYFRPDELVPDVRRALSNRKLSRVEKSSYFTVRTHREAIPQVVVDEGQSHFCDATPVDGVWTRTDPSCKERINYKTITTLSDYITVRVDPVWAR